MMKKTNALIIILAVTIVCLGVIIYILKAKTSEPLTEATGSQAVTQETITEEVVSSPSPESAVAVSQNTVPVSQTNVDQNTCTSNSPSTITVLSPNGGEEYTRGGQMTVTWSSCNIPKYVAVILNSATSTSWHQGTPVILAEGTPTGPSTPNDGTEVFTIPSSVRAGQYKVWVRYEYDGYTGAAYEDVSDGAFRIQ